MWPLLRNLLNARADTTDGKIDTVDAVVDAVLARIGAASPASGATTDVMKFIKLVYDQLGADSPGAGARTDIMSYLKLLEEQLGGLLIEDFTVRKMCVASANIKAQQATEVASGINTYTTSAIAARFIAPRTGKYRLIADGSCGASGTNTSSSIFVVKESPVGVNGRLTFTGMANFDIPIGTQIDMTAAPAAIASVSIPAGGAYTNNLSVDFYADEGDLIIITPRRASSNSGAAPGPKCRNLKICYDPSDITVYPEVVIQ